MKLHLAILAACLAVGISRPQLSLASADQVRESDTVYAAYLCGPMTRPEGASFATFQDEETKAEYIVEATDTLTQKRIMGLLAEPTRLCVYFKPQAATEVTIPAIAILTNPIRGGIVISN